MADQFPKKSTEATHELPFVRKAGSVGAPQGLWVKTHGYSPSALSGQVPRVGLVSFFRDGLLCVQIGKPSDKVFACGSCAQVEAGRGRRPMFQKSLAEGCGEPAFFKKWVPRKFIPSSPRREAPMSDTIDVAIVGGGVVGCWLALELAAKWESVFVFEKNPGITQGENQSSRNSGVLHAGINYDQQTRPLKARLCVEGNRLWYEFCARHRIPCRKTGKLMVASTADQVPLLEEYLRRAQANRVPDVRLLSPGEIRELEPNVKGHAGLLVPTSGIIEPTRATYQVYALASNLGAQFVTHTRALSITAAPQGANLRIRYRDGIEETVSCRWVINAAGVYAVDLARTLDPSLHVRPSLIRGDSMKFYRTRRPELFVKGMNVYPTPIVVETWSGPQHTVGVHLTPTLDQRDGEWVIGDTVTVGPKLVPVSHVEDHSTPGPSAEVYVADLPFFPDLTADDLEPHQCGVQARLVDHPDFLITRDRTCPNVIHLLGIDSPGLTSAPAIARMVSGMLVAPH